MIMFSTISQFAPAQIGWVVEKREKKIFDRRNTTDGVKNFPSIFK